MTNAFQGPLAGIRVLEFGHMVMGPSCGLILADMGAEVIKIEPCPKGDKTRYLGSFGTGVYVTYNRNKKSVALDTKSKKGKQLLLELVKTAHVVTENFRLGGMDSQGLGYEDLRKINPTIIYCSLKGFLPGPYDHRAAMDEAVQMMTGLAFMTGPPGQPTRAGASLNDIMGGMFGVIGILSALRERETTGAGCIVKVGLFESCALLMAQHMAYTAITGNPNKTQFTKENVPWPVYDLFDVKDEEKIFIGVVTNGQWQKFCMDFALDGLLNHPKLQSNSDRTANRDLFLPQLKELFKEFSIQDLSERIENLGCPFAPIAKPEYLFDDKHLNESNGLLSIELPDGNIAKLPALPLDFGGTRFPLRKNPPLVGEDTREVMSDLGLDMEEIETMLEEGILVENRKVETEGV